MHRVRLVWVACTDNGGRSFDGSFMFGISLALMSLVKWAFLGHCVCWLTSGQAQWGTMYSHLIIKQHNSSLINDCLNGPGWHFPALSLCASHRSAVFNGPDTAVYWQAVRLCLSIDWFNWCMYGRTDPAAHGLTKMEMSDRRAALSKALCKGDFWYHENGVLCSKNNNVTVNVRWSRGNREQMTGGWDYLQYPWSYKDTGEFEHNKLHLQQKKFSLW